VAEGARRVRVDKTFSKDEGEGSTEQHHLSHGGTRCRERRSRYERRKRSNKLTKERELERVKFFC